MGTFTGTTGADNLTGTDLADVMSGGSGDDILTGLGGDDKIDGGKGADTMTGGLGNDTYFVDNVGDKVIEATGQGTDTVKARISWTLGANIENLYLIGSAAINGTGNDADNKMYGNAATNTLSGLGGNDYISGGAGADTMIGGLGNDTYIVDNVGDTCTENAGEGSDQVRASVSHTLGNNIEKLLLTGVDAIDGTGNGLANTITGNAAANTLTGLGGNDRIDGGAGADHMNGGAGNDTFYVDNAGDVCGENVGEGTDTVNASVSHVLGANIEALILTGTAAINGTGNTGANTLTGNDAVNVLSGLAGNDTILAGGGNDTITGGTGLDVMTGGAGNDAFVFTALGDTGKTTTTADEIVDFTSGDKVDLHLIDAVVQASGYGEAGDQAFVFIGQNNFHNHTGGELRYMVSGGNTYIMGEVNGDTTADFVIRLDGTHTITSADIVL
ncbi:calcium-binding protein [Novosphingobium cyanobacteriorum]|uniref:Calcium-binding protein n=1 Tax=Novosphingobium cyanobacteriorum TaxID=3024215 RepID=A0ABT6CEM4_9SPHN|nr:calcium-binding protein [Novosphingobium cyanobacteriorum]MDF8331758.1 calcium-binding protein [Novosphingobium cyanobacteriorum]